MPTSDALIQSREDTRIRRALGAFYTPAPVVQGLLDRALEPVIDEACASSDPCAALRGLRVLDLSCGEGAFLIPAAARIIAALERAGASDCARDVTARGVMGVDINAQAVERCAENLRALGGCNSPRVFVRDALREGPGLVHGERFDVVLGNPPYLNQLERETSSSREVAALVRAWSEGRVKGYADAAAAFWLLSTMLLREGGRCALVLPRSILSTRDAGDVRSAISASCALEAIWFDDALMFDASVRVCAPIVRKNGDRSVPVARSAGPGFIALTSTPPPNGGAWSSLLPGASDVPPFALRTTRTLGDIADATADFRDQYYGLAGCILEDEEARRRAKLDLEAEFPRLITSGLIDRDGSLWGERSARILKTKWTAPRLDRAKLERETSLGAWLRLRLTPKVLLATQTRVLEPLLDVRGELAPCVPVITITPKPGSSDPVGALRTIHRVLRSPLASAFAARMFAGAALSPDALKLSAKQALTLPLVDEDEPVPESVRAWFTARLSARSSGTSSQGKMSSAGLP